LRSVARIAAAVIQLGPKCPPAAGIAADGRGSLVGTYSSKNRKAFRSVTCPPTRLRAMMPRWPTDIPELLATLEIISIVVPITSYTRY
jgi:hypothetical protein